MFHVKHSRSSRYTGSMRRRIVFHGTLDPTVDPKNLDPDRSLHVGTRQAAVDRIHRLSAAGSTGQGVIHEFEITERPSPMVFADPGLESHVSEERLKSGGRWWQVAESNREGDISRPRRYINEFEDPGSMSYVVMPHHLRHLSTQFLELPSNDQT